MELMGTRRSQFAVWVIGWFFIALSAICSFELKSYANTETDIIISIQGNANAAGAYERLHYYPKTGKLRLDDSAELKSFGPVPNLTGNDLEVLLFEPRFSLLLLRHGPWYSLINYAKDELVLGNIGPAIGFTPVLGKGVYTSAIRNTNGAPLITFAASPSTPTEGTEPKRMVFIIDAKAKTVGWFFVRGDLDPDKMHIALIDDDTLQFRGSFDDSPAADMEINIKTGEILEHTGASLLRAGSVDATRRHTTGLFTGMLADNKVIDKLFSTRVPIARLLETGNPNDPKARSAALALSRAKIETARRTGLAVRNALKGLYGQADAVEAFVRLAQQQVDGTSHAVVALGGPDGVGKTHAFHSFVKGFLGAMNVKTDQPVFEISMETVDEKKIETDLFGAKPPYIGADTPSNFVLWLLKNPQGGGIYLTKTDRASIRALETLLAFFEKGEVAITPYLMKGITKYLEGVPTEEWPAALRDRANEKGEIAGDMVIKLSPWFFIGLETASGAEIYGSIGNGRQLTSVQDIEQANRRFTGETIKTEMLNRKMRPDMIGRIASYIPFKMLLPNDHSKIVDARLREWEESFSETYRISFKFTDEAREFFSKDTFTPQMGAKNVQNQITEWVAKNLRDAILDRGVVVPGDTVQIDVAPGDGVSISPKMALLGPNRNVLADYTVGRPLPPRPTELLARAEKNLIPVLEKRIVGHRDEIKLVAEAIIAELKRAVFDPKRKGKPVFIYFDGTPGIGKTEIAKAVAEALFDDQSRMTKVEFGDVIDMGTFYKFAVEPMRAAVKTSPESIVMLWDEIPRAGDNTGYKLPIQNTMLSILDEARLPATNDKDTKLDLPPASVILATGNLVARALGPQAPRMSAKELQATFGMMLKHPASFLRVFSEAFVEALRSRMGNPIIFSPLTDEEIAVIRDRMFKDGIDMLTRNGLKIQLSDSAKDYFIKEREAMQGARWVQKNMKLYIENPLVGAISPNDPKFQGVDIVVSWNEEARTMSAAIIRDGNTVETRELTKVPRSRSDVHPEAVKKSIRLVSIHEAGHAIVEGVFNGPDAVSDIYAFGSNSGGVTQTNTATPEYDNFLRSRSGIKLLAVLLAGRLAEMRYLKETSAGASSDNDKARAIAMEMLVSGSAPDIAPIALIKNPSSGNVEMSEEKKLELERKIDFLLEYATHIAMRVLELNDKVHGELADKLAADPELHMSGAAFTAIVKGRMNTLSAKDYETARRASVKAVKMKDSAHCENVLNFPMVDQPQRGTWFTRLLARLLGR